MESTAREVRHNFRIRVRKRFSIFNVNANYTLQKVLADVQPNNANDLPMDNYNLALDFGRAPFPLHNFNTSVNAQLPLGLFLTGVMQTGTGRYYSITTGKDDNRDTQVTDRPSGVGKGTEVGPSSLRFDFNISKAFFLSAANGGSQTNVNVFANMTNAFNRVNLGVPSGVISSPNFGRSTSASDAREIEVGIRFQF
jgi:hypothetical protein